MSCVPPTASLERIATARTMILSDCYIREEIYGEDVGLWEG